MTIRKYGYFAAGSLALVFLTTTIRVFISDSTMEKKILKMAFYVESTKNLDPATIVTSDQYTLLRNLYGRLVDYDAESQLVAGIADSFETTDNSVSFYFGNKVKTIDGHIITAKDAEVSLKRIIMKGRSGHGDIRRLLCPGAKLKTLDDPCEGIESEGNKLTIRVLKPYYLPLLLQTLESADYSIIPEKNIEKSDGTLKDNSHRNTSGPYFADFNFKSNSLTLKANPTHHLFHRDMPQEILLMPAVGQSEFQDFIDGKIDFIPTTQSFSGREAQKIVDSQEYEIHETLPLKILTIHFSSKALKEFSSEQRLSAAVELGKALAEVAPLANSKPTAQFFQPTSEGSLSEKQLEEISKMRVLGSKTKLLRAMEFEPTPHNIDLYRRALNHFSGIRILPRRAPPTSLAPEERPDIFAVANDSAWTEDLNLLGYNFQIGTFAMSDFDSDKWFADYLAIEDRAERIKKLTALHFEMLKTVSMFPVQVAPYFAAIKKPWRLNQFKTAAGTRLWLIRRN